MQVAQKKSIEDYIKLATRPDSIHVAVAAYPDKVRLISIFYTI